MLESMHPVICENCGKHTCACVTKDTCQCHKNLQPMRQENAVSFNDLREANVTRKQEWPGDDGCDLEFTAIEFAGEAGELMEAIKKFLRGKRGIKGSIATLGDIAEEMGDVLVALDLLANMLGIDLGNSVRHKFNKTSEKYGLETRL